ncbi:cadherin-like beta sandwich domain-containing protein [Roseburia sp. 499]|uniref:cadherin-like beta sandwich domain-containing protein n=1 Tax=Roseburia sp. 499 TaxID=1261634 RepID=UPI000952F8BF|nr:cadherin-like beta sandwich domain-containing protein [Roseburia sp. 499]WVK68711.1 cadherin-like beta sandwich domain-containing protein [Roseburia sp. 499]
MKGLKKYLGIIMGIIMAIAVLPSMPTYASGKVVVAVSASSLNIGDSVTITATAQNDNGEQVSTTLGFSYDSSKFSFVSCSDSNYSGGEGGKVEVTAAKASITLKATASGSASVSVSGSDGLTAGGTKIAINDGTESTTAQSGDNSLSSLKISPGTLSPAFSYKTTSYTASVGADVNEISVDAKPSNAKATIESITGNTGLKEGTNTISIVVKAENGAKATYKIAVNKGGATETPEEIQNEGTAEENPDAIILNGHEYNLSATIPADKVPADFTKVTANCRGQDVEALQFNMGDVVLVYLTTPDAEVKNTLAVYEQQSGSIYPFVKIEAGSSYYIILNPPADVEMPEMYAASAVEIGEYGTVTAYGNQEPSLSDFYLIYAVSNAGNTGWYQYDKTEGTLQRYVQQTEEATVDEEVLNADMKSMQNAYDKLDAQYTSQKNFTRKAIAILIFVIAVLVVIIVNLFLRGKKNEDEWEDDFNEVPKRFRKKAENIEGVDEDFPEDMEEEEKPKRGIWKKKTSQESEQEDDMVEKKKVPEKKVPEKKVPEQDKPEDDFEVIDLDDL